MTDGYITTDDGVRLYFERIGAGERLLLIPNGPPFLEQLRPLAATRTIVAFDARNRGRSDRVTDEARLARALELDRQLLRGTRGRRGAAGRARTPRRFCRPGAVRPRGALPRIVGCPAAPLRRRSGRSGKLDGFERRALDSERHAFEFVMTRLMPALQSCTLHESDLAAVRSPVLTIHARRDRSAPHAGGREWVRLLPDARLVTIENAGHMPWIESRAEVLGAIETFLTSPKPAGA